MQEYRQCSCKRNNETCSRNRCYLGKAVSVTYSECVSVAVGIQHETRIRRIICPPIACLAVPYFSTLSHKRHDFRKNNITALTLCVLIFSTSLAETYLVLRRIERDFIINIHRSSCKVHLIVVRF